MGASPVWPAVAAQLDRLASGIYPTAEVAVRIGNGITADQVSSAVRHAISRGGLNDLTRCTVAMNGRAQIQVTRFETPRAPTAPARQSRKAEPVCAVGDMFECVGFDGKGSPIIKGTDNELFRVVAL